MTNYLSEKIKNVFILTTSYKFKKSFNKQINLILPKKFWNELSRRLKYLICIILLIKFLLKNKNSVVFAFQANLYCILVCKLLSVKIIVKSNSAPEGWSKNFIKKFLYKKIIKKADKIMVNSHDFKISMKKKFKVNCEVIYNPLNTIEDKKKFEKKNKKFISKKTLRIINVGRYVDQKDQITLLKSLNLIRDKINFHLILMGRGFKKKLLDYINLNNLKNNVTFIILKKSLTHVIKMADLFILSSKFEGLPNVLLEAIVLKKFIISSNCPTGKIELYY